MYLFLFTLHILVAFALIFIVLLQAGRGGSLGAIFGGASQAIFGPRGPATILNKLTIVAAVIFMGTSIGLTILSGKGRSPSIMQRLNQEKAVPAKEAPAPKTESTPSNPQQQQPPTQTPQP